MCLFIYFNIIMYVYSFIKKATLHLQKTNCAILGARKSLESSCKAQ